MCPPVLALASVLVSGLGAVAQHQAQTAQFEAQVEQKNASDKNALAAQRDDQKMLTRRQLQEQEAYGQKVHLQNVEAAERGAEATVSAAEGNVAGISVGNLSADIRRRASNNLLTLETNYRNTASQLQAEQDATVNKAASRIGQVANPAKPSAAGAMIGFAGTALEKGPTIFKL